MLWLGTDMGLVRFDPTTVTLERFLQQDGLPGSAVYAILEGARTTDDLPYLWISTNQDLARFDRRAGRFRRYVSANGTHTTEFNRRAAFKNARGTLFFGGLNGVTLFDPDALQDNPYVPPIVLTQVEKASRDGTIALNPLAVVEDGLVLQPDEYSFSFEFAALNFLVPEKNQYAYKLEGVDERWVEAGTRRFASYTGLSPGTYTFRVKGSNNDGVWNEEGIAVQVTVLPAFWQTWWFRVLVVVLIAGVLIAAYRYRMAYLLKMEHMRLRIAGDLHDDVGSKLSGIALMSEMIRDETMPLDRETRQTHLTNISTTARQLVDGLRDIVWFITPEHDKPGEMVLKMKDVAGTLLNGIGYTLSSTGTGITALDDADMIFRRNVYLIYKEALNNIARHAHAETVDIILDEDGGLLILRITDDGVGFDPAQQQGGHGLSSMAYRAEQIGASLHIESAAGTGTRLTLTAKITHSRNGAKPN